MFWTSVLLGWVLLCTTALTPLLAAETRSIASGSSPLTVRSGPGVEYGAVSRLPHGTEVILHDTWGQWARITSSRDGSTGWVPQAYLSFDPPAALEEQADMSREQEERRFTRLRRKGVIEVQRSGAERLLRLVINPLIWYRLTPHQQENFLRRAQRYFGGTSVEMRDRRNDALLARLTATGDVEFTTPSPHAPAPANDAAPTALPISPPDAGNPKPGERQ